MCDHAEYGMSYMVLCDNLFLKVEVLLHFLTLTTTQWSVFVFCGNRGFVCFVFACPELALGQFKS